MSYRTMLVLLDNSVACAARLRLAIDLSRDHDAHLVGLAPTGLIGIPPTAEIAAPLVEYSALARDMLRDLAETAAQHFRDACHAERLASFEAIVDEADTLDALVRHAACNDLTIVSYQGRSDTAPQQPTHDLAERLVLQSARPTLVIPSMTEAEHVGAKVLVAWDSSREASRALGDALPILRKARRVELVWWREVGAAEDDDDMIHARLDAVHRWLVRHDVASHGYLETADHRLADSLRSRAVQMDADLIVMGAYGRARWTERILGGATHGIFNSLSVPVLMSH